MRLPASLCLLLFLLTLATLGTHVPAVARGAEQELFTVGVQAYRLPLASQEADPGLPESSQEAEHPEESQEAGRMLAEATQEADHLLLVTVTPAASAYTYASASQTGGKPSSLAALYDDNSSVSDVVLYPPGVERHDRFLARETRVYPAATAMGIPFRAADGSGKTMNIRYRALVCTDKSCTPVNRLIQYAIPDEESLARLPAASDDVLALLRDGVRERNQTLTLSTAPTPNPNAAGGGASSLPFRTMPRIHPDFFAPSLEVGSLGKALVLGFLAGILLNLMPCVLPVLGLKLAGLTAGSGDTDPAKARLAFRRHQLFFALGILVWFMALGLILASLGLFWGQIFQSTWLVLALAVLMVLLACNLFGIFSLPMLDLRSRPDAQPDVAAFTGGLTATLLATPCSGPLLGGVLSWSLLQPLPTLVMSLGSVGLGMASPYLIMALKPELGRIIPKSGSWTTLLEQFLGFFLLGTAIYLLSMLPQPRLPRALVGLLAAAFAAWLWGRIAHPAAPARRRYPVRLLALAILAFACLWPLSASSPIFTWKPYSRKLFLDEFGARPMVIQFTADWCPTCKAMEATTLTVPRMKAWQAEYDFLALRVDLTEDNPAGQELLRRLGSASIPVLAFFPSGDDASRPVVIRDVASPAQVREAMRQAFVESRPHEEVPETPAGGTGTDPATGQEQVDAPVTDQGSL